MVINIKNDHIGQGRKEMGLLTAILVSRWIIR